MAVVSIDRIAMKPELLVGIKDIMALSGVSERTAKRRLSAIRARHSHADLWRYCARHGVDRHAALEFMRSKRYDPLHVNGAKRVSTLPHTFEITTWEEKYALAHQARSILFQEMLMYDVAGSKVHGRIRYFIVPMEYLSWHEELGLEVLENFMARVLPVDEKAKLLEFYGLMVMKRRPQRNLGFVLEVDVDEVGLYSMAQAMRRVLRDKKAIWFCQTEAVNEVQREALGFWEIKGAGHAIAGLPGYDGKGRVEVWVEG